MLTTISKTFDFDAAHRLDKQHEGHKCRRLHGHTYRVEIRVRGEPGGRSGMVIDYADLANAWATVHSQIDHQTLISIGDPVGPALEAVGLQPVMFPFQTTTEKLAEWIEGQLKAYTAEIRADDPAGVQFFSFDGLSLAVRVYESSTTSAEVGRT